MAAKDMHSSPPSWGVYLHRSAFEEPTLGELLADPMTQALMRADHVDPSIFTKLLHSAARNQRTERVPAVATAYPRAAKSSGLTCGTLCPW